ncbi:MAG: hypothetical protein H0T80_09080 [Betaproteobacteria bacterium]|nr:hypothetical protein [Betaproteobacteria bacterium]
MQPDRALDGALCDVEHAQQHAIQVAAAIEHEFTVGTGGRDNSAYPIRPRQPDLLFEILSVLDDLEAQEDFRLLEQKRRIVPDKFRFVLAIGYELSITFDGDRNVVVIVTIGNLQPSDLCLNICAFP